MSILSLSISTVNPAARSAAIRRPATMPRSAVALGRARDPITGRFVAFSAPWGVQTVMLPTGIVAYRVGPNGQIFGNISAAKRNAAIRRPSHLAPADPSPRHSSPVVVRGWEAPAMATTLRREFGAGLGVEVDADDLRAEWEARTAGYGRIRPSTVARAGRRWRRPSTPAHNERIAHTKHTGHGATPCRP